MANFFDKLTKRPKNRQTTLLRSIIGGSMYRVSDLRGNGSLSDIRSLVNTMRQLSEDSQISTALSYYATDATTPNTSGDIIWATACDDKYKEVADIINTKFKQWNINAYARDHILELASIGNLYLPTTDLYREPTSSSHQISLDGNTLRDDEYEPVPAYKLDPQNIIHIWHKGNPLGYVFQPKEDSIETIQYDEDSIIHFTLGGLLGDYSIPGKDTSGNDVEYDIQFGRPLMTGAIQPTQTLSLLEDALVLSSLTRVVRFVNVDCGNAEEEEIQATLQTIKDMIEQQLSINTATGDAQSFINPQSPNNLIYLPKINNQDAVSITDMNMAESTDSDNKLLEYYQDKKLSVLGVPKEAMNFSSSEGLGGAGAVMSQRSALYANSLQRIETAYMTGWRDAINKYFIRHSLSGYVDKFELHMNPIVTQMSQIAFDRRDSALSQAVQANELLNSLGVDDDDSIKTALTEILTEALPKTGASVNSWKIDKESAGFAEGGIQ